MTENESLELKKRSRRRLVGAAALALLAAIVLPMVMDQEPGAPVQDIQVTIPDREADAALARPIGGGASAPDAQTAPAPQEQSPAPGASADVADPVPAAPPATASAPPRPPARPDVAAKPTAAPSTAPAVTDAERAAALLEDRKPASAPAGAFVVQIGAFGEAAKASAIGSDLKSRGFAAYTEKAGAVTRVRVGPFRSREEADRTAERLRLAGVSGVVVPR